MVIDRVSAYLMYPWSGTEFLTVCSYCVKCWPKHSEFFNLSQRGDSAFRVECTYTYRVYIVLL